MTAIKKIEAANMTKPNIGLDEKARTEITEKLSRFLGTSFVLQMKTLSYHWNVTGPNFVSLHDLFQAQYTELQTANDDLAERIRALGAFAPGSFKEFQQLSKIQEDSTAPKNANEMIENLLQGHEACSLAARKLCENAQKNGDEVTADMAIGRMNAHDKAAWILRALTQ